MAETTTAIENFSKILKQHTVKKTDSAAILEQIAKVKQTNPTLVTSSQVEKFLRQRSTVLASLADSYFEAQLMRHLPQIDDSLFKLKRHIVIKDNKIITDRLEKEEAKRGGNNRIACNLFQCANLEQKTVDVGKLVARWSDEWGNGRTNTTTITVKVPTVPEAVMQSARKGVGSVYKVFGDIFSDSEVNDLYSAAIPPTVQLGVIWIPTVDSFNIKSVITVKKKPILDPALIINVNKKSYLVKTWDITEELPFEHYLREYSHGNVSEKITKKGEQ